MTVEAVAVVKWKKDQDDSNVPDRLDDVIGHTIGNKWEDITGQDAPLIPGKITGNTKNLAAFRMQLADDTWDTYDNDPQIEWIYWEQTDEDGSVLDGNADDILTISQFNALTSWLISNGFDPSGLSQSDTRRELLDKLLVIFLQ